MKMKMLAHAKYIDFTVPKIKELADYKKLYKTSVFPVPYVSI